VPKRKKEDVICILVDVTLKVVINCHHPIVWRKVDLESGQAFSCCPIDQDSITSEGKVELKYVVVGGSSFGNPVSLQRNQRV
jgi:hypothetical protein